MQSTFKLKFLCLFWLVFVQVHSQDIEPEFPEEFPTTTIATTTTPSDAVTELVETTTTADTEREPITAEAEATTEMPQTTTTNTETLPSTTTNRLPFYPTYLPPVKPHYGTTTSRPVYWDVWDSSEEERCYLREQEENSYVRWSCGITSWAPMKNCYRCCYYGYSRFAGCNKLYSGPCRNAISASWFI